MSRARPAHAYTLHAVVVWPFAQAVRGLGTDVPGLSDLLRLSASERIAHEVGNSLLEGAVVLTRRDDLGLLAAEAVEPGHFELVELAARAQRTVGEGLSTLSALVPILHDGLSVTLARAAPLSSLRIALAPGLRLHPAGYDFVVASLVIGGRRQTGVLELCPSHVRLPYPRDGQQDSHPLARLVRSELEFGAEALEIVFETAVLDAPLLRANASLSQALQEAARELLPRSGAESTLERQVRALIAEALPSGAPDTRSIARKLHVSERTLRRRLEAEGIGLRALIDGVRRELALAKLEDPALSTHAVAAQLGFSTAQALHRAFRRWTGGTVHGFRTRAARAAKPPRR